MNKKEGKKIIILTLLLSLFLSGCGKNTGKAVSSSVERLKEEFSNVEGINLAALKGPTTIGLVKMIDKYDDLGKETGSSFTMYQTADELAAGLSKGDIDIAALPANLAASLYNKTGGEVKVAAINTLGVLYIVDNGTGIERPEDLSGKTIYTIGKGTTPEGVLKSFIEGHDLKDVKVEYRSEASEIAALLKTEKDIVAMLPEPFVTVVEENIEGLRVVFNMNREWMELYDGDLLVTGVLAVRKDFLETRGEEFDEFLETYERSIKYTMTNVEETAKLAESQDIIPVGMGIRAIPRTNIVYIDGDDMERHLKKYLTILYNFNEKLVGGKLPDEDFYYKK